MKKFLITACAAVFFSTNILQAQTVACDDCQTYTVLSGVMPESRLLLAGTRYLISDCYVVPDGITLTIPAGTQLFGDAVSKGMLIVDRGGTLIANGASNSPIVFTSCRPVDERAPGDWGGITIFGKATNNQSGGEISLTRCSTAYAGGHTTTFVDNDNSGSLQYVQIHYAGGGNTGDQEVNGLTLVSVGSSTTLEHIQVTHSQTHAFAFLGGTVNKKYLAGYNNYQTDFRYDRGYTGLGQFLVSLRMDPSVYDVGAPTESNGILVENNSTSISFSGTPLTRPILSNVSIFGPRYCDDEAITGAITGVTLRGNANGGIFNSFVAGYPTGLYMQDAPTIVQANNDLISFAYSSFYRNNDHFESLPTNFNQTGTFCVSTIDNWMTGMGTCVQLDNDLISGLTGYDGSICNESYCGSGNRPVFELVENEIGFADFSADALDNPFFETDNDGIEYRGAFGGTDWTSDWTNWCAQETDYCPELQLRKSRGNPNSRLNIAPNPSGGTSYALFDVAQTGVIQLSVLDKVSGQVLHSSSSNISTAGAQRVAIPGGGLQAGVYIVQVVLPDGSVLSGQLFVW